MPQAFTKNKLSGSVNGKSILLTGTASAVSTPLHTAVAGTTAFDEVWLYGYNSAATSNTVTIEWGDTTVSGTYKVPIPSKSGRTIIADGRLINNGLVISAFADTASVAIIDGFVNQIV
jgi:hypothetical protein